ncbi:hypothetical protein FJZ18_02540 [Candidatus Pacearchaeota archaeon]|nr:hypothetical protein [Candidatus Pacearchaeota archaeon]
MDGMYFCQQCGKMLELIMINEVNIGKCDCGFSRELPEIKLNNSKINTELGQGIYQEDISTNGFPHICKKCGYGECDVADLNPPYSDESNIYLYRCKKCKFVERQADGTGNN